MVANPIACAACGGRHGHSLWCPVFEADNDLRVAIERISEVLDALKIDPKMRGRLRSMAMNLLCKTVKECADEATQEAFADAMYRAGYHRPW